MRPAMRTTRYSSVGLVHRSGGFKAYFENIRLSSESGEVRTFSIDAGKTILGLSMTKKCGKFFCRYQRDMNFTINDGLPPAWH